LVTEDPLQTIRSYWILFPIAAYLLGSIPFGRLIGQRVARIDITERGSGNIGATNVARELGIKWGILTLVLDLLKGFVPVWLSGLLFPNFELGQALVGITALIGHQFSLYERFRGGKGVATTLGVFLAFSPLPCLLALLLFVLTVYLFDFVSLGSIISAALMPFILILFRKPFPVVMAAGVVAALICIKHKGNIQRLMRGEERRLRKRAVM
jgi:glycerol-3-phosphate acyltransferase PlsY